MANFLIIGAGGLIGKAIAEELDNTADEWKGTYSYHKAPGLIHLDITDAEETGRVFKEVNPEFVIHCANLAGGVDYCESNPLEAERLHFEGTVNLGKECLRNNAKLIFISTECVFDGKKQDYKEEDAVSPLSVYGRLKAESEAWISKNLTNYIIIRTSSVYGWDPDTHTPNAIMKLYFFLSKKQTISAPVFRWSNPTLASDLAKAIIELSLKDARGVYHVCGSTFIDRYSWFKETCESLGWDASLVIPKESKAEEDHIRPERINLNNQKFRKVFKTKLHSFEEGLVFLRQEIGVK